MRVPRLDVSPLALFCGLSLFHVVLFAGCAGSVKFPDSSLPSSGVALRGTVHGGQQVVSGSAVYLFAAGTTGYNSAATSLLNTSDPGVSTDGLGQGYVTSDASGAWAITGDYTCPSAGALVYLVVFGGNPGLIAGTNNNALALLAALGPCGSLTPATFININEVTTVASVYALAQFANPTSSSIATSATNVVGLTNAFGAVNNLANVTTGLANATTIASNGTAPQATLDTLANILSTCVNSTGATSACSTLFSYTTPTGGTAPTNTVQAALNIALHPLSNVPALYGLVSATGPFQPTLSTAPYDWTVAIYYPFSNNLSGTQANPAIDSQGNVWGAESTGVLKMSSLGVPATGSPFADSVGVGAGAVDLNDNFYFFVAFYPEQIYKYSPAGVLLTSFAPYSSNANLNPYAIAIDSGNNLWTTGFYNSVSKFNSSGILYPGFPVSAGGPGCCASSGLVVDSAGDAISPYYDGSAGPYSGILSFNNAGTLLSPAAGFQIACPGSTTTSSVPSSVAIDRQGNYWIGGSFGFSACSTTNLVKTSPAGAVLVDAANNIAGYGQAIDGNNNIWSLYGGGTGILTELDTNGNVLSKTVGSATTGSILNYYGQGDTQYTGVSSLAIDGSGNVWEAHRSRLYEFIGLAPPVVTPLAAAAAQNEIGTLP